MKPNLKFISREKFETSRKQLFSDARTDRCFAEIITDVNVYTIAWRSDLIIPVLIELSPEVFAVGVDQKFIIVNFKNDIVKLNLELKTNLYDIRKFNEAIFVIAEMEIYKIDMLECKVIKTHHLPDYFKELRTENEILRVICLDGSIIEIN
jgi:hypothetical protein